MNGLKKVDPNKKYIKNELNNNWEVLTEAVQTVMRYEGYEEAYEKLKSLSRGTKIDESAYKLFVSNLEISKSAKVIF